MRWMQVLLVVGVVAAGCSDDAPPADPGVAAVATDDAATAAVDVGSDATNDAASGASTTTLVPPPPTDPPELEPAMIGDLQVPCGSPAESLPERRGITDDAITIGVGTDRGGLTTLDSGRGVVGMVEALADFCNAQGGMFGRDIRVIEYDAAGVEGVDRVEEACAEVTALVGDTFLQDDATGFAALGCALPRYRAGADLVPTEPFTLHAHLAAFFTEPDRADEVVLVGPATPSAQADRDRRRAALESAAGIFRVAGDVAYPIEDPPNWEQLVGDARFSGAGQVHITGGCRHAVLPFLDVADQAGWNPLVVVGPEGYDPDCLEAPDPSRIFVELPVLPFEDGAAAEATAAHAELLDAILAPRTGMALLAADAFWRWAVTAAACLPDAEDFCVDRSLVDGDWTAGGLHPGLAADRTASGCAVVMGIENGAFVRRLPEDVGEYDCAEERSVATVLGVTELAETGLADPVDPEG